MHSTRTTDDDDDAQYLARAWRHTHSLPDELEAAPRTPEEGAR